VGFYGEISADMLQSVGVQTVILGHSERRAIFHETDAIIANKVDTALEHDMTGFCFMRVKDRQSKTILMLSKTNLKMVYCI
jgi:triosephosphate isomerase